MDRALIENLMLRQRLNILTEKLDTMKTICEEFSVEQAFKNVELFVKLAQSLYEEVMPYRSEKENVMENNYGIGELERVRPYDYKLRAKYVLSRLHNDYKNYKLCKERNIRQSKEKQEFIPYGITKREFVEIYEDCIELKYFFSIKIPEYKSFLYDFYLAGISREEYQRKYMPDKKVRSVQYIDDKIVETLAKFYESKDTAKVNEDLSELTTEEMEAIIQEMSEKLDERIENMSVADFSSYVKFCMPARIEKPLTKAEQDRRDLNKYYHTYSLAIDKNRNPY